MFILNAYQRKSVFKNVIYVFVGWLNGFGTVRWTDMHCTVCIYEKGFIHNPYPMIRKKYCDHHCNPCTVC